MFRVLAAAVLTAGLVATASTAGERHPQHDLKASSHGRTIQATRGTHCTPRAGGMVCGDFAYPLETERRLRVHGGGRITLEFAVEPEAIYPELRNHRSRAIRELRARGGGRERRIRLPRVLPRGTDRLGVFVMYRRGDADFEVDLKRHRH